MPPKRKEKVKLTPEEKKARLKERRAERKRKAAIRARTRKFEHLEREIKYGKVTYKRQERNWRQMLIEICKPHMRAELEIAWHNFERSVDNKDFMISLLLDEVDVAEVQYLHMVKQHMANIDNLIELCFDQLGGFWNESKKVIQQLYTAANVERADLFNITKENEEYLKTMIYMLENQKKETERMIRFEYMSKQEIEETKLIEVDAVFKREMEKKYVTLWKDFEKFYKQTHTLRKKEFEEMKTKDDIVQEETKHLWHLIYSKMDKIKTLNHNLLDVKTNNGKKIEELKGERRYFQDLYNVIRDRLLGELEIDQRNLTLLTMESNATMMFYKSKEHTLEKILKMGAICRKLETIFEKTMSFPTYDKYLEDEEELEVEPEEEEKMQVGKGLGLFWEKISVSKVSLYKMNEYYERLKKENKKLRMELRSYCLDIVYES